MKSLLISTINLLKRYAGIVLHGTYWEVSNGSIEGERFYGEKKVKEFQRLEVDPENWTGR